MTSPEHPQDETLMQRIVQRDQQAIAELYQQYGSLVYSLALRVCGNAESAQEVVQDTFLKVWRQTDRWDAAKGRLVVWLLTITRYTAIDYLRREARQPQSSVKTLDDISETVGKNARVDETAWQDRRIMMTLLTRLPPEQQQVIELAFYQGMSHSQIAEHLRLPLGTVKTRLRLAMQKIKAGWLAAHEETQDELSTTPTTSTHDP
jgi:RNA polymerase sigma-70 factor, ECF subfamily